MIAARPTRTALALLLCGMCGCATEPPPQGPTDALEGWVGDLAEHPERFGEIMEQTNRDGWIAMHEHRYAAALDAFEADTPASRRARARAAFDELLLRTDLASLSTIASARFFDTWAARGGVPAHGAATAVAALGSWCQTQDLGAWAEAVAEESPGAAVILHLQSGGAFADFTGPTEDPFAVRSTAHAAALNGDDTPLLVAASAPLLVEAPAVDSGSTGFQRSFCDPCAHGTLAAAAQARLIKELGGEDWTAMASLADGGLESTLFAAWATPGELAAAVTASAVPADITTHLASSSEWGFSASASDDLQAARGAVQLIDDHLAAWRVAHAQAPGMPLVNELGLVQRARQHWLTSIGRAALNQGHVQQARVVLEAAFDPSQREVGVGNAPSVLALIAQARLRQGHTREALDALQILIKARPDVGGIVEVVADLSVLEGLDRHGDSKEH